MDQIKHDYKSPRWSNEISDCSLPMTFDTYSNCSYGCVYCFSQYQRGHGLTAQDYYAKVVRSVEPKLVKALFNGEKPNSQFWPWVREGRPIQWGGLSDQFDEFERKYGITLELLKFFRELRPGGYPICFSTKAAWPFQDPRYIEVFKGADNWNIKFSIITLDEKNAAKIERGVPSPKKRFEAIHNYTQLNKGGATLRLRPFIVGVSSKDYKDLIVAAHDAGATAVTTEFFCLESRASNAKQNYETISECAGFDIVDFYRKYSNGTGYLRLNRAMKQKYIQEMETLCHKLGMRFYVSDAHFKEACDNSCCCALPEGWDYSRGNFSYALQLCRKNGKVHWTEIDADMEHLNFLWYKGDGFNTNSTELRAKYEYMTMRDYLHYLWNNPTAGQNPYKMFGGVMKPAGRDAAGDLVYVWDPTKTFVGGCSGCSGCHG